MMADYRGFFEEGYFGEREEIVGEREDDELGGGGIVGYEVAGVFCQTQGAGEDFIVDPLFPAFGAESLEVGFQLGEEICGWEKIGLYSGAVEGGDYVEVE